jgi:Bacterial regulatory proteins, tetR family
MLSAERDHRSIERDYANWFAHKTSSRLSFNEGRQSIIEAVKAVFAETGFDGTTSRELAKAAGVSEPYFINTFRLNSRSTTLCPPHLSKQRAGW